MTLTIDGVTTHPLTLPEELIVMLLNQETGYFHQVPGWDLNCAVIGAVLAELSLEAGRVLSHDQLMARVWRTTTPAAAGIVRSAIKRLRRKFLEIDPDFDAIETVYGLGYRYRQA